MATSYPSQKADKFLLRLPEGIRDQIAQAATASNRTMTKEMVLRLQASFEPTNTERVKDLELALAIEQHAKSEERMKAAHYASALRVVADRLPANAFDDNPAIAKLLKSLDMDRKARVIATLEQMAQDKLQTLANLDHLVETGVIKIDK